MFHIMNSALKPSLLLSTSMLSFVCFFWVLMPCILLPSGCVSHIYYSLFQMLGMLSVCVYLHSCCRWYIGFVFQLPPFLCVHVTVLHVLLASYVLPNARASFNFIVEVFVLGGNSFPEVIIRCSCCYQLKDALILFTFSEVSFPCLQFCSVHKVIEGLSACLSESHKF